MPKYRKKPVEVEAEQFWPDKHLPFSGRGPYVAFDGCGYYVVTTHRQKAHLESGDWVVLEPNNAVGYEFYAYPVKPDIFEQTYEPVETPTEATP